MLKAGLKEELLAALPGRVRFDEPMRLHTSFHLGGPAEIWAEPNGEQQLQKVLEIASSAALPITLIGGGANLLVRDEGIPGLVVHLSGSSFQYSRREGHLFIAGAALPLEWLVRRAQEAGLSGAEFLAGVPGQVGGGIRMNAGTHDDEGKFHHFGDIVQSVRVMDYSGNVRSLNPGQIGFRYRGTDLKNQIVLEAQLDLSPGDPAIVADRVKRLWEFKKKTQDWSSPSVGCIFKNPKPHNPGEPAKGAGWMIDQAGLKGTRIGGAMISNKHANFIMNLGDAKAADVFALIEMAREKVKKQFGADLELEVQVLPRE